MMIYVLKRNIRKANLRDIFFELGLTDDVNRAISESGYENLQKFNPADPYHQRWE